MKETISIRLMRTLLEGKKQLGDEALTLIRQFVQSQREADGVAFLHKSGEADLYYTAFGWSLCYALGIELDARKRKEYLEEQHEEALDLIHYAALMRCRLLDELMRKGKLMMAFTGARRHEVRALSSFEDVPQGDSNNPYSQFIWRGVLEDTGNASSIEMPDLKIYHVKGWGYANSPAHEMPYLNATAAALAVRGQAEGWKPTAEVEALRQMQEDNGGFKASEVAPVPDLLSTATALFVLGQYGVKPQYEASDFITSHWLSSGGFAATLLDDASDVEYTFYGLLALGTI